MEFSLKALLEILRQGIREVPAVRYALGVAGISAAAAIVYAIFQQKVEIAIVGTAIMLAFMVVLLVFAALSRLPVGNIKYPALLLLWVIIVCFCAAIALLTTSFFFDVPIDFRTSSAECNASQDSIQATQHRIENFISDQCILANRLSTFVTTGAAADWGSVREKVRSYRAAVPKLDQDIQTQPDLFKAIGASSYDNFRQLLDQKLGVASDDRLSSDTPPSDRSPFEDLAKRLRNLATKASKETAQSIQVAGCPRPVVATSRPTPCINNP